MTVGQRRNDTNMFLRLMLRSAFVRHGRTLLALGAMTVAAAVAATMLNLYVDAGAKLRTEFRKFGANVVAVGRNNQPLPPDALARAEAALEAEDRSRAGVKSLAVPFAYVIAHTASVASGLAISTANRSNLHSATNSQDQAIVVAGTDFTRARLLNSWWDVSEWPSHPGQALVGVRAKTAVSPQGQPFDLVFTDFSPSAMQAVTNRARAFKSEKSNSESSKSNQLIATERRITLTPVGNLSTGADEDSRIYISLMDLEAWTHVQSSTIEFAVNGSAAEVVATVGRLSRALPEAEVHPVRQIVEAEARVLGKTQAALLAVAMLVILTATLCVFATLVGSVFDRRRDFAVMKALGASEASIHRLFLGEVLALGAAGAILGTILGSAVAAWIGRVNFHTAVTPRLIVFPWIFVGSLLVALLAAVIPLRVLRRVQPAVILRGE